MEQQIILKVGTEEAVKSVGDLKDNIKILKKELDGLEIGTDDYTAKLNELKLNQNALKDAMYATSASMTDVAEAAAGMSQSYNSLVHRMAALKEEWRATNDEARRAELGRQIAEINQQLKDMDASVGNFQRNVGNYESGTAGLVAKFDEFGGILKQLPPTLGPVKESMGKVGETMQLIGKQPLLGIIGLLAPIIMRITESLKGNATAMDAVKKIMDALQPVMDFFSGILESIAQGFSNMVDWLLELVGSGAMDGFISKIAGVGNAILQYMLAPIKSAIAAVKGMARIIGDVFKGDWSSIKDHAKETGDEIAGAWKEGFSFKANFEEGQKAGKKFVKGTRSKEVKDDARTAGQEIGQEIVKGIEEEYEGFVEDDPWAEWEKNRAESEAMWDAVGEKLDAQAAWNEGLEKAKAEETQIIEDAAREQAEIEEAARQQKIRGLMDLAAATSDILGSIADGMEINNEKDFKRQKGLQIAQVTINTLSGAVGAFMQAMSSYPAPAGAIIGAAQAAAATAAGIAQISKIRQQQYSASGSSSGSVGSVGSIGSATVTAPNIPTDLNVTRSLTSASEEDRLNRTTTVKAYIVDSELQAKQEERKAVQTETSF